MGYACKTGMIVAFATMLFAVEAHARCENAVCGNSRWDGRRVNIYLGNQMTGVTHYNFRTNPGAQIEISARSAYYSFERRPNRRGTYSAQACRRGGFGQASFCTQWATFVWSSRRNIP